MNYDAIIIGAGHNGLVCAAYLAKAGKKVAILERRSVIGGCAVTEEIFPGCKISRAAYVNSLFRPEIIRELKLPHYGLQLLPRNPASFTPFPDNRYLILGSGITQDQKEIAKFSQSDALRYPEYEIMLNRLVQFVEPLWKNPPPAPLSNHLGDFWRLFSLALKTRRSGEEFIQEIVELFTLSAGDLLDRWFESEGLKATLATDGVIGALAGPYTPGTAYVLLHHVFGETNGKRGVWAYVRGGMGSLSDAIASVCRDLDVDIFLESCVEQISLNHRATGVTLTDGRELTSKCVVSSIDPQVTFLGLLTQNDLSSEFKSKIEKMDFRSATLKMNLHLSELPDFNALPGKTPGPQHLGTIHLSPTMEFVERAYDDVKYGHPSQHPMIEATLPSTLDDSLAPEGEHVMGIFCQYAPYALKNGDWETEKTAFANRIIDDFSEYAPNFRNSIIEYELLTPPDMERIFGLTGGNIFHGAMTPNQLFFMRPVLGWADHRTPVKGLYLCGSGTHPGGGVTGAPGRNAAQVVLRDLR